MPDNLPASYEAGRCSYKARLICKSVVNLSRAVGPWMGEGAEFDLHSSCKRCIGYHADRAGDTRVKWGCCIQNRFQEHKNNLSFRLKETARLTHLATLNIIGTVELELGKSVIVTSHFPDWAPTENFWNLESRHLTFSRRGTDYIQLMSEVLAKLKTNYRPSFEQAIHLLHSQLSGASVQSPELQTIHLSAGVHLGPFEQNLFFATLWCSRSTGGVANSAPSQARLRGEQFSYLTR
ncbi:uncharacterized protein [Palaemon carinicauda]|uniref:uncharacterized protein n=1 Tax=Palaemon carinicauda TaxID=392227 RepID=UPI0035B673F1